MPVLQPKRTNLALISSKGYDYVCVSRSKIKEYKIAPESTIKQVMTKNEQFISLQKVEKQNDTDYILKVNSKGKQAKEQSMKNRFEERFLEEIRKINASLQIKNGVKKIDKVNQRIGRAMEKYPSVAKYYDFEVEADNQIATKRKTYPKSMSRNWVDIL